MLKTTAAAKISALKATGINENEVVGACDCRVDKTDKTLAKFKFIKKSAKIGYLEQPIFLSSKANAILFMKDDFNQRYC